MRSEMHGFNGTAIWFWWFFYRAPCIIYTFWEHDYICVCNCLFSRNIQLNLVYCVALVTRNMTQFSRLTQFLTVEAFEMPKIPKRFCFFSSDVTFVGKYLCKFSDNPNNFMFSYKTMADLVSEMPKICKKLWLKDYNLGHLIQNPYK